MTSSSRVCSEEEASLVALLLSSMDLCFPFTADGNEPLYIFPCLLPVVTSIGDIPQGCWPVGSDDGSSRSVLIGRRFMLHLLA